MLPPPSDRGVVKESPVSDSGCPSAPVCGPSGRNLTIEMERLFCSPHVSHGTVTPRKILFSSNLYCLLHHIPNAPSHAYRIPTKTIRLPCNIFPVFFRIHSLYRPTNLPLLAVKSNLCPKRANSSTSKFYPSKFCAMKDIQIPK